MMSLSLLLQLFCIVKNNKELCFFFLLIINICGFMAFQNAYAQIQQDNKTVSTIQVSTIQEWIDPQENVKIQFRYSPAKPMLYTITDLKLSIQDLNTGNNLRDLYASIAILKGDKIFFKYNNIAVQNGYLSLKVQFTEDGNYQLISQIRSKENISIALASFNILVPLQPFGSFDVYSIAPLLLPIGLVAIFGAAAIVIFILIVSRRKKRERKPGI
jgi:hypothetical protein